MGDDKSSKNEGVSNKVSLVISVLALLISAGGLYWQFLRGPRVRAYQPNVVYVAKSQIGIPIAFTNEGTTADVVVSGSLDLTPHPQALDQPMKLIWVSPFERKKSYDQDAPDEKQKWADEKVDYVLFSHLPIKAGDTDAEIFWFQAPLNGNIDLQPVSYHGCGRFMTARRAIVPSAMSPARVSSKDCSFSVDFEIPRSDLSTLGSPAHEAVTVEVK